MNPPRLFALTQVGADLAARIRTALGDGEVWGLDGRVVGADGTFERMTVALTDTFEAGRPIIALCAAGIVIRALAPRLADKSREPPVIAVAENGRSVVPLLGGHNGANQLACKVADILGVDAAITTASETRFAVALDSPPPGYRLANRSDHKAFAAALLAGARVRLDGEAPWLSGADLPWDDDARLCLQVTTRATGAENICPGSATTLVYHPRRLLLGVGCERGTSPEELLGLARTTFNAEGLAQASIAAVCSIDVKADEAAVHELAASLGVPARFFPAARLEQERQRLVNPSDVVFAEVGCHGVAEGAALAAAGEGGELLVPKQKSPRATCAVGQAPAPVDATTIGRARGHLAVVGIGPGDAKYCTPAALDALRNATDIVGYSLYLDLAQALDPRTWDAKGRHPFGLGEERQRVEYALALAGEGREVALVCSGDPGIYAMASLVFEVIENGNQPNWARAGVSVIPGICAAQMAAARAGAPLGHDFCTISLSDLLTPPALIQARVEAAVAADMVIAFYNPASKTRTGPFEAALRTIREHRASNTPVVVARSLGRAGEMVREMSLGQFGLKDVDMLTVVLVGSSQTRVTAGHVYTPRGYSTGASGDPTSRNLALRKLES